MEILVFICQVCVKELNESLLARTTVSPLRLPQLIRLLNWVLGPDGVAVFGELFGASSGYRGKSRSRNTKSGHTKLWTDFTRAVHFRSPANCDPVKNSGEGDESDSSVLSCISSDTEEEEQAKERSWIAVALSTVKYFVPPAVCPWALALPPSCLPAATTRSLSLPQLQQLRLQQLPTAMWVKFICSSPCDGFLQSPQRAPLLLSFAARFLEDAPAEVRYAAKQ
jgi:hypothetical protein